MLLNERQAHACELAGSADFGFDLLFAVTDDDGDLRFRRRFANAREDVGEHAFSTH
jgi:hypothetical protein